MNEVRMRTEYHHWSMPKPMTIDEFNAIGTFIQSQFGIKMPPTKRTMLQSRLTTRLRAMNMSSYGQYREYLFSPEGLDQEVSFMIDVVTTNKTDFFRENTHFDLLQEEMLPLWLEETGGCEPFHIWSAGCATGEEPYSLAMVLNEFAGAQPDFDYSILATDISGEALEKAQQAIYPENRVRGIPEAYRNKYLLRGKDRMAGKVRIVPELRRRIEWQRLNLMEDFTCFGQKRDVIFCRNVIIYFDRPVQEMLFEKCCRCLKPGGFLFIGHSETLNGMRLPLKLVRPTVYQRV